MHKATLRTVGGSTVLVIPPAFLEQLEIKAGAKVGLRLEEGLLVIEPDLEKNKPSFWDTAQDLVGCWDGVGRDDLAENYERALQEKLHAKYRR